MIRRIIKPRRNPDWATLPEVGFKQWRAHGQAKDGFWYILEGDTPEDAVRRVAHAIRQHHPRTTR